MSSIHSELSWERLGGGWGRERGVAVSGFSRMLQLHDSQFSDVDDGALLD